MPADPDNLKEKLDEMVGWKLVDHERDQSGKTTLYFETRDGDRKAAEVMADEEGNGTGTLMTDYFTVPSKVVSTGVLQRPGHVPDLPYFAVRAEGATSKIHPICDPEANGPGWLDISDA